MQNRGRILVVDGDKAIRELVSTVLTDEGYAVEVAPDTVRGFALVYSFHPQLIILDLLQPHRDDKTLVDTYRALAGLWMRIVALSTAAAISGMEQALGVDVCIVKPFDLAPFLACIEQQLTAPTA
jgi:DNA-binding response OmpR family regulator